MGKRVREDVEGVRKEGDAVRGRGGSGEEVEAMREECEG